MAQIIGGPSIGQILARNISDPIQRSMQALTQMQLQNTQQSAKRMQGISGVLSAFGAQQPGQPMQADGRPVEEDTRIDSEEVPTNAQQITEQIEKDEARQTALGMVMAGVDPAMAVRAGQEAQKIAQKERLAKEKQQFSLEFAKTKEKEKRITSAIGEDRELAKESSKRIEASQATIKVMDEVDKMLDSGTVETGVIFAAKKWADIEKSTTTPQTQLVAKNLAGELVANLATLPAPSLRLKKAFETAEEMSLNLKNTEGGLRLLSRAKRSGAIIMGAVETEKNRLRQEFADAGRSSPLNLDLMAYNNSKAIIDKQEIEIENIVGESIGSKNKSELAENFKIGTRSIWPQNNLPYVVKIVKGKKTWRPFKPETEKKGNNINGKTVKSKGIKNDSNR